MNSLDKKWKNREEAADLIERWRLEGQSIVFTNGCFDLLHYGHVHYLERAKGLGGKLVLGLNGDDSVRRLKGEGRPVNPVVARAGLLSGLECVDLVIPFHEDTPAALIRLIKPDILVKGGDYQVEEIVGAKFVEGEGGQVVIIPFVEGYSTSSIIRKLKAGK